jgi:hypothetical protein
MHQWALTIYRNIGARQGVGTALASLANRYAELGQTRRAIELYEEALTIYREIGERYGEALVLANVGLAFADLGRWNTAVERLRVAAQIGEAIGNAQALAAALTYLASTLLQAGNLSPAAKTVEAARNHPYPQSQAWIALVDGIIRLRLGDGSAARQAFAEAVGRADQRLDSSPQDYDALDTKALALAGLTLIGPPITAPMLRTLSAPPVPSPPQPASPPGSSANSTLSPPPIRQACFSPSNLPQSATKRADCASQGSVASSDFEGEELGPLPSISDN